MNIHNFLKRTHFSLIFMIIVFLYLGCAREVEKQVVSSAMREEIKEGDIVDEEGIIIGRHKGIIHYTVGQRRGLGISSENPLYVTGIDAPNNRIVVSDRKDLFSEGLIATDLNLIAVKTLDLPYEVQVKIRINHTASDATLFPHEENKAKVLFKEPQMALTPGQSAVFYSGDTVLGGGVIEKAL